MRIRKAQATPAHQPAPLSFMDERHRTSVDQALKLIQDSVQACDMVGFLVPRTPWRIITTRMMAMEVRAGLTTWTDPKLGKVDDFFSWEARNVYGDESVSPEASAGFSTPQEAWNAALAVVGQRLVAPFLIPDQKG